MTRIDDAAKTLTDWADSEGGLESVARGYDGDLTGAVEALDDAGRLLPDLPEPDVITPRTDTNPAPIGLWSIGHPSVTGSPSNPPVVFIDEHTDLPPDEARAYAYAIIAAADYAEGHTNDQ